MADCLYHGQSSPGPCPQCGKGSVIHCPACGGFAKVDGDDNLYHVDFNSESFLVRINSACNNRLPPHLYKK